MLAKGIREIHNHNVAKLSFEENYRYAYNLVLYRNGDMLYTGVVELITENLKKLAKEQILPAFPTSTGDVEPMTKSQEGERLLKALRAVWDDHISSMNKLKEILKYMVRPSGVILSIGHVEIRVGPSSHPNGQRGTHFRRRIKAVLTAHHSVKGASDPTSCYHDLCQPNSSRTGWIHDQSVGGEGLCGLFGDVDG